MTKSDKLKSCPFCGLYPKTFKNVHSQELASCCGATMRVCDWNTRTSPKMLEREELRNIIEDKFGIKNMRELKITSELLKTTMAEVFKSVDESVEAIYQRFGTGKMDEDKVTYGAIRKIIMKEYKEFWSTDSYAHTFYNNLAKAIYSKFRSNEAIVSQFSRPDVVVKEGDEK